MWFEVVHSTNTSDHFILFVSVTTLALSSLLCQNLKGMVCKYLSQVVYGLFHLKHQVCCLQKFNLHHSLGHQKYRSQCEGLCPLQEMEAQKQFLPISVQVLRPLVQSGGQMSQRSGKVSIHCMLHSLEFSNFPVGIVLLRHPELRGKPKMGIS